MLEDEWLTLWFKAGSTDALRRMREKYRDPLLTPAMALLNDVIAELPDEQREVVLLRLKTGMEFRDIAAVQRTTRNAVLSRYAKSRIETPFTRIENRDNY